MTDHSAVHTSDWPPAREAALQRLADFTANRAANYANVRNLDQGYGNHTGVSRLSPWIKHRGLLETEVIKSVIGESYPGKSAKFIQEVFWRGYWKGWLEHRPEVWKMYRSSLGEAFREMDAVPELRAPYEQAVNARTHIALFNNWVEELQTTGYLHNHARMWFASIWIFTLRLPWQLGADFFYRQLLDGDPAANTLSWRWVAGLHTKGKVYAATRYNILRNAEERGQKYSAGLASLLEQPEPVRETPPWPTQPQPLHLPLPVLETPQNRVDLVVLHEDDLGYSLPIETTRDPANTAPGVVALEPQARSERATAPLVTAFSRRLLSESVEQHHHANSTPLSVSAIVDLARRNSTKTVVTPFAPVGPVNDALNKLDTLLEQQDISLRRVARNYDRMLWPHARKGFFAMNKKIPELLSALFD